MKSDYLFLASDSNQTRGMAQYAIACCREGKLQPSDAVLRRTEQFHVDSIGCAIAAFGAQCNAPRILRQEALAYRVAGQGAYCLGSDLAVQPEKAVLANCSAVRELDANGTNFGYNPRTGQTRGEFGHNDFYPVAVAGAQVAGLAGEATLRAMVCLDEIRGRLAEAFGLKDHKIDHVLHGAIASAAVYGALVGATEDEIESAIGLVVAHHVPFRAIRAGHQLSDSKGASAAISAEVAVAGVRRAMRGFVGPADILRNPQAVFCLFEPPEVADHSPFDLTFALSGDDFAVMGMHFKLGLYEHQSAGAIQGLIDLLQKHPELMRDEAAIKSIRITIYEPAFGIIGDPAKRDPRTRQSADHSMVYIVATLLRKAIEHHKAGWKELMLVPSDYDADALRHPVTRRLMDRIEFRHGGPEFDAKYPDGIPTTLEILHRDGKTRASGLVMYPAGHARNHAAPLEELLDCKLRVLCEGAGVAAEHVRDCVGNLASKSAAELQRIYGFRGPWE